MGALSTLTLRHTLMNRLDQQLIAASERAANRRHGVEQADTAPQAQPPTDSPQDPDGPQNDDDKPTKDGKVPPGLDATGQSTGTLTVVISGEPRASGSAASIQAAYIDTQGHYTALDEHHTRVLLGLTANGRPETVRIDALGDYRAMASRDPRSGDTVIIGLSMEGDKALVRTQLLIETGIVLLGAVVVALAGRAMVRSSLAPLERVARTAHRVASQPLERGEVSIEERVPAQDLASSTEVGQVGGALNTLLGHVEGALAARQQSETQVRQFVADASHELRTPLASIRGYTELIQREGAHTALPPQATHALERVHSESLRMTALVEDLLLLARLDAGRELRHEEVDLVGLVVDTVADARAAGPEHHWELDLEVLEPPADDLAGDDHEDQATPEEDFIPEPALVIGDEARLHQVMVNLLANARVHTPAGTRVVTTVSRQGSTLVVRIADDGPGIDPEVRDRLFERFARADSSRERRTGSTGLGMSIALAIVQSHRGSLTVESSTGTDHGTVFTIALPAAELD
ncbi:sensor histidine kinase [Actinomyces bowdenii]|uniref:histidine kinase n=1 Tax=Actinomyces bowdenii TaxID=131109 RepID=A0A853EIH0_9ACTO|nr:HAMP domain-containing sensor histidine kinase [Actinomyces bowdenii]MBF0696771.1 HAMP domain-containing histidine kinase [Actinomyces bowdenii]MDO5063650.1 HAMP domain-containing sensor histidine kinase [Actinomyces bowdenii]NYS68944.1 HAMP domain-containing histidine kinase [Actinomyces bowdenii]